MVDQALLSILVMDRAGSPWYDNGWLIGIMTGLASGALLAAVTPIFLHRRRARKLAVESERPGAAENLPDLAAPSSAGSATFGSPLHLGSGDINQAAHDIHTHRGATPSRRPNGSVDPSTDLKGGSGIDGHE
jgi:hypothetical protein